MTIDVQTIEHVAKLARLALSDEETQKLTTDMGNILNLVEQLGELDLSGVNIDLHQTEPTLFRPDVAVNDPALDNLAPHSPSMEDGFFRVPKILDDGN